MGKKNHNNDNRFAFGLDQKTTCNLQTYCIQYVSVRLNLDVNEEEHTKNKLEGRSVERIPPPRHA